MGQEWLDDILVEDLGDVDVAQGATVTDLADLSVLDGLAELGSAGVLELGGGDVGLLVEQGQDLVVVGDGAGGQVADEPAVALGGLGVVQGDEGVVVLGGPLSASGQESGSQNEAFEEDDASQEAEGGRGGRGDGGGGAGGGGGSSNDEGGGGHVGEGSDGHSGEDGNRSC